MDAAARTRRPGTLSAWRASLAASLLALAACATPPPNPPMQTVAAVDLGRYAGTWHEIARYPNAFQDRSRRCEGVTATYAIRPDGQVAVTNRCRDVSRNGEQAVSTASAYAVEGTNNAKLRVSFFWPFYGNYWVIGLDPDYRWAVVGEPSREYLWILSRTPTMADADRAAALAAAAAQGYDTTRLQPTPP
jgi:apolipoprotein D and lipocalin family protein